jgi:hypothetical protein
MIHLEFKPLYKAERWSRKRHGMVALTRVSAGAGAPTIIYAVYLSIVALPYYPSTASGKRHRSPLISESPSGDHEADEIAGSTIHVRGWRLRVILRAVASIPIFLSYHSLHFSYLINFDQNWSILISFRKVFRAIIISSFIPRICTHSLSILHRFLAASIIAIFVHFCTFLCNFRQFLAINFAASDSRIFLFLLIRHIIPLLTSSW